jgi:predicted CXXCH cytochrome family protein
MKKIVVLVALMSMVAGSAFAVVSNTPHDLSSTNTGSTSSEICVFCHTPHNADISVVLAPLWNRTTVDATGNVYSSSTLDATGVVLADINATDAPLCLSCHAAGAISGALQNPPNAVADATAGITDFTGNALLSTVMNNDHPIGFDYADGGGAVGGLNVTPVGVNLVGATNEMWCSSCHDVHDNSNGQFLIMNNAGSNLCLACHVK